MKTRHIAHLIGPPALALVSAWALLGGAKLSMLGQQLSESGLSASIAQAIVTHVGLSALVWAGAVALWRWGMKRRSAARRVARTALGTVMVETIIIIMPMLVLINGLAQLTINNIAGLLTDLAAFQATRAVWLWAPEASAGRMSVNTGTVQNKARLAAAASVAPVVPASPISSGNNDAGLDDLRATMFASFNSASLAQADAAASQRGMASAAAMGTSMRLSTASAYDTSLYSVRAARKLTFAYDAVEVTITTSGNVGAQVSYKHYQAFPLVGVIFGQQDVVQGRPGFYSTIERSYTLPQQTGIRQR